MKYNYEYEIKYQEVDGQKKLRLFNLENYPLEVAGTVADDLGFGIAALHPMGLTWILTHLSVIMYELPTHCEKVRFETWIESNVHMLSTRNFRIYSGERLIGICKSVWAVLDLKKREIVNCFDLSIFQDSVDGEFLKIERVRMTPVSAPSTYGLPSTASRMYTTAIMQSIDGSTTPSVAKMAPLRPYSFSISLSKS